MPRFRLGVSSLDSFNLFSLGKSALEPVCFFGHQPENHSVLQQAQRQDSRCPAFGKPIRCAWRMDLISRSLSWWPQLKAPLPQLSQIMVLRICVMNCRMPPQKLIKSNGSAGFNTGDLISKPLRFFSCFPSCAWFGGVAFM